MDRNFSRALSLVLKSEGGFVNDPRDPGGATNKGVTIATYRSYVDPKGTVDDLKKITDAQVATVYRRQYWDVVHGAELPDGVDYAVFDFAVNSGPDRAKKYLQAVVGVTQDGRVGPQTIAAVQAQPPATVINALCDKRLAFLKGLSTWPTYGKGWTSRVASVRSDALKMVTNPPPQSSPGFAHPPAPIPAEPAPAPTPSGNWLSALISAIATIFKRK
jgi:lysozyme family protein